MDYEDLAKEFANAFKGGDIVVATFDEDGLHLVQPDDADD